MLVKAKELQGYKLNGIDGEIGKVKEFYFDDNYWTIRYLVADTGGWLTGRQVLISPYALIDVNKVTEHININLTKKQIEDSPSLDSDKPVSRQFEESFYGYYGSPRYWGGLHMWGNDPYILRDTEKWGKAGNEKDTWDSHLRSTNDVSGHYIQAKDREIGHVKDFIIDEETWAIRYLIIDTTNWFGGKRVLISPKWIDQISWKESKVIINLSAEEIKQSPEYNEESMITRDYETELHRYYNRMGYWSDDTVI
jgi:sporulation protein YlmC with PRC-barrel domain